MSEKMKVGIAGLGTVGATLAARLLSTPHSQLELTAVSARDRSRDRGFQPTGLIGMTMRCAWRRLIMLILLLN